MAVKHDVIRNSPIHYIPNFLIFLKVEIVQPYKQPCEEPLIDYTKSIMMILEHYLLPLKQKAIRKEKATKD